MKPKHSLRVSAISVFNSVAEILSEAGCALVREFPVYDKPTGWFLPI
jgi:hypothetical protein